MTQELTPPLGWQGIETLPHPHDAGMFWGAIRTCGITGPLKWDVHLLALDDETHEIDPHFYAGWTIADYELWQPCVMPPPPTEQANEGCSSRKGILDV